MPDGSPWYKVVINDDTLEQGDILNDCPIVIPSQDIATNSEVVIKTYDVIVMSQSCDLEQKKLDLVLVSPIWEMSDFEKNNSFYRGEKAKEALRRGFIPGYHLLNKSAISGFEKDYLVVDFRNVYGVNFDFIVEFSSNQEKRLRLLPPYKEHLSQAFARFFMRVGLPSEIPKFYAGNILAE